MKKLLFFLSLVALIITACDDDDDDNNGNGNNNGNENIYEGSDLKGDITEDISLDASVTYALTGTLSVKDGGTLTIPAGTKIKAQAGSTGFSQYVIVEQGGKIYAEGTADAPIVFTSGAANPAPGDWGGLIINGYAPISGASSGTTSATEIDNSIPYGGTDAGDNSGVIKYVTLEYTGARSSSDIEHNGLTLDAVGSGTTIENIYVPYSADDGVEFFGGTVTVKNILVVDPDDDMFDNTQGWTGSLENAYGIWLPGYTSSESDPRGIESDGNLDGKTPNAVDQSNYTMNNITIVNNSDYEMDDVIKIRRGATANITNALAINGKTGSLVNLYDDKGSANVSTSIDLTAQGVTYEKQLVNDENVAAQVNFSTGNTGANISAFGWTGFNFPDISENIYEGSELIGNITDDVSLDASVTYTLAGTLSVKAGGILRIPAGTMIKAKAGDTGFSQYVIVEQGGKIFAEGTAEDPIVFTSGASDPAPADWGGLIINGYAPISGASSGTSSATEIDNSIPYGGSDSQDNSGVVKYVILEYTGARSSSDIEHNGLTLDAVGSGTTIENIYVPYSADDGVEFFGGSVTVKNILVVDPDDDMFDNTQGWTGSLENAYGIWMAGYTSTEADPRGIESDGNLDGKTPNAVDQSNYTMNNITIVNNSDYEMNDVIKIRRGATANITNALAINGKTGSLVNLYDDKGSANPNTSINLTATNVTAENQLVNDENIDATVTFSTENTGADASAFAWTGFSFPSN